MSSSIPKSINKPVIPGPMAEPKTIEAAAKAAGLKVHYGRHMLDYQMELIGKFIGAL